MNLNIDTLGGYSIVPIRCGRTKGTAFFVSENKLLTATHIIASYIDSPSTIKIQVMIADDKWIDCSIAYKCSSGDVTLLNSSESNTEGKYLDLLSSSCPKDEELKIVGFPMELGNGIDYFGIDIKNLRHLQKDKKDDLSRGFNVIATRSDELALYSYCGFSGSPVLNSKEKVVGVATDQFYNSLSYTSILVIKDELESKAVSILPDDDSYNTTKYGNGYALNILDKKIIKAGERYSPKTHVDDIDFNRKMSAFCRINIKKQLTDIRSMCKIMYEKRDDKINQFFEQEGNIKELKEFIKSGDLEYKVVDTIDYLKSYTPEFSKERILVNPLRKYVEKMYSKMIDYLDVKDLVDSHFLCLYGAAGQGKTHSLCRFLDIDINRATCNFYFFFGTDFGEKEPIDTMCEIMGWEDNALKELDDKMETNNRLAIFVIDALNEGIGSDYWFDKIPSMKNEFEQYKHIKLIISFRSMTDADILNNKIDWSWQKIEINGFRNTKAAIKNYFEKSHITLNVDDVIKIPEFQSPIFLKIFCEVYHQLPRYELTKYNRGLIYLAYLSKRNLFISKKVDEDPRKDITTKFINTVIEKSVKHKYCSDVLYSEALGIANKICKYRLWSNNLLNNLLQENIIKEYKINKGDRFVDMEYDSIGDYLKMMTIKNKKNDEQIKNYIINTSNIYKDPKTSPITRTHFDNVLTFLFSEWNPKIEIWNAVLNDDILKKIFIRSLSLRKSDDEYSNVISPIIEKMVNYDLENVSAQNLLDNFMSYTYGVIKSLHEKLCKLSIAKRDEIWTIQINKSYDQYGIIGRLNNLITAEEDNDDLIILICWFMTSSYPEFRAKLVKILKNLFQKRLEQIILTINLFKDVDDPYVMQGVLSASYAALVFERDIEQTKKVAEHIRKEYYLDKLHAPNDLIIRNWSMKIIELAAYLDNQYKGWSELKSMMPFNSVENPFDSKTDQAIYENKDYFGTTSGAQKLYMSLFEEDFSRYIIGTNSNAYSPILHYTANLPKNYNLENLNDDVNLYDIECAIANIIKNKFKYSNLLGQYDNKVYHGDRMDQNKERIGKKYQWLGYYYVLSYLCDNCKITLNRWEESQKLADYSFPWFTGEIPRTDPTISIEEELSVLTDSMFNEIDSDFNKQEDVQGWIKDQSAIPYLHHIIKDKKNSDWVVLNAFDTQSIYIDNDNCSASVWYHPVIIGSAHEQVFEDWCKESNNRIDIYDSKDYEYMWNDFPWASAYKERGHGNSIKDELNSPCDIWQPFCTQLQENFAGSYAQYEFLRSADAPYERMMEKLHLHTAERGVIRDESKQIVAININPTSNRMSGLVINAIF